MVYHKHTPEMCPAGKVRPDKEFATRLNDCFKESGLRVEGYVDGPAHEFYFVIEADDISELYEPMKDLLQIGVNKIAPVVKFSDAAALARRLELQK